jgi:hypothetical protein
MSKRRRLIALLFADCEHALQVRQRRGGLIDERK